MKLLMLAQPHTLGIHDINKFFANQTKHSTNPNTQLTLIRHAHARATLIAATVTPDQPHQQDPDVRLAPPTLGVHDFNKFFINQINISTNPNPLLGLH